MSTRREFAKTAVGALFGVSAIPAVGLKPRFPIAVAAIDPSFGPAHKWTIIRGFWAEDGSMKIVPDITIAQKIALKDRFS